MPAFNSPVLQNKDFRFLLSTRFLTALVLQMQAVIVGWQIYQIRPEALLLGLIGLTEAIPAIAGAFFSGHFVDIYRPAAVIRLSILALFLNTSMLLVAAIPALGFSEQTRLFLLFSGVFISGASRIFISPAVFSLTAQIVGRPLIAAASAWNSSMYQFSSILGPALGGLVYGFFGATAAFALLPILMLCSWFTLECFSKETKELKSKMQHEPFLKSIRAGFRFAFGHKVLLSAMTLDMFSVLFGGAVSILPIFADKVFGVGALGLGLLRAAPSVGSVIVGVMLALRPQRVISGARLLLVVVGFGISTILFALSSNFYLALFFLALSGVFDGISMVIRTTLLQLLTPDDMRGRVSSLSSIFITSSNEIGAFESGVAAQFLGLIPSVIFGGVMTIFVVMGVLFWAPELKKTELS